MLVVFPPILAADTIICGYNFVAPLIFGEGDFPRIPGGTGSLLSYVFILTQKWTNNRDWRRKYYVGSQLA